MESWISFMAVSLTGPPRSRLFVAPYRGRVAIDSDEWIQLTDGWRWDDKPHWSHDGKVLFFLSDRDGFRCVWKLPLDPETKQPAGKPELVRHFHSASRSPMNLGTGALEIGVTRDRIVINLGNLTGNIWMAELEEAY